VGSRDAENGHQYPAHGLDHHPTMARDLSLYPAEEISHLLVTLA
jgi:hypothetical protein